MTYRLKLRCGGLPGRQPIQRLPRLSAQAPVPIRTQCLVQRLVQQWMRLVVDQSPSAATGIRLSAVEKWYGSAQQPVHALSATDLDIAAGELVVLLGPSGCGKTTLLRMLGGLIRPTHGDSAIGSRTLWSDDQRDCTRMAELGLVFQEPNLFPWLTVAQNIALPLELRGVPAAERIRRAAELAALVGIQGFEQRWPRELSGGMRQRAAIARSLAHDPRILLMDEPFGALDAMTRDAMNLELQRIWRATGKTIVLVTHSITEAVFLADRIVLLSPRPGRIDWICPVEFARPRAIELQSEGAFQALASALRKRLQAMA